jgi:hypothetical protein
LITALAASSYPSSSEPGVNGSQPICKSACPAVKVSIPAATASSAAAVSASSAPKSSPALSASAPPDASVEPVSEDDDWTSSEQKALEVCALLHQMTPSETYFFVDRAFHFN